MRVWFSMIVLVLVSGCPGELPFPTDEELGKLQQLPHLTSSPPADPTNKYANNAKAAALGDRLFHEKKLSGCGTVSCESCHSAETFTVDKPATGCPGTPLAVNPPTLFNTAWFEFYFWNGRADRLWSQAIGPILNPNEMASSEAVVRDLLKTPDYAAAYAEVFPEALDAPDGGSRMMANVGKAIAAYESTAKYRKADSSFDTDVERFIEAVKNGQEEKDPAWLGLKVFVRKGVCIECHKGSRLSDSSFHNVGLEDKGADPMGAAEGLPKLFESPFNAAGAYSDDPRGEFANRISNLKTSLNAKPEDFLGAHKTPTLRGIKLTAPYMHNGKFTKLEEVIDFYNLGGDKVGTYKGKVNPLTIKPLNLTDEEKAALLKLLQSM